MAISKQLKELLTKALISIKSSIRTSSSHLWVSTDFKPGLAANLNNLEALHYLLLRNADINFQMGPFKKSALHIAVENNAELSVKFLLRRGADIEQRDIFGFDVYDQSENRGLFDMMKVLDRFKAPELKIQDPSYEELQFQGPFKLEDMYSSELNFRPGNIMEVHTNNFKNDLDNFHLYILKDYSGKFLPNHPSSLPKDYLLGANYYTKLRKTYDESYLV